MRPRSAPARGPQHHHHNVHHHGFSDQQHHHQTLSPHDIVARRFVADSLSSWGAYVSSLAVSHPLDTIRVRWQTLGQTPAHTLRVDGVRSLFAGMVTPAVVVGPVLALIFSVNEWCRDRLQERGSLRDSDSLLLRPLDRASGYSPAEVFVAGALGGAASSIPFCPLAVVRVHQQNSARAGSRALSASEVLSTLWRTEGLRGPFRALHMELYNSSVGRGLYFLTYECMKQTMHGTRLYEWSPSAATWASALLTSCVWWGFSFPADLIKTRVQADALGVPRHQRRYRGSTLECLRQTVRLDGMRGLYSGFTLTLARSLCSSGTALPLYDAFRPRARAALGVE